MSLLFRAPKSQSIVRAPRSSSNLISTLCNDELYIPLLLSVSVTVLLPELFSLIGNL